MGQDAGRSVGRRGTLVLAGLGLVWLAAYLWAANASIDGAGGDPVLAVIDAALALPGVIAATMLAGAACGVSLLDLLAGRRPAPSRLLDALLGLGTGLVIGALAGGLIVLTYGHRSSITVLAGSVLAAGGLGGLLGGVRPRAVVAAGLAGTVGAYVIGFALNYKQDRLLRLFGGGPGSPTQAQAHALLWLTLAESLASGVIAGIVGYRYLHRRGGRFAGYLAAGAMPGILLLLSEVVTRIGGARLLNVAGNLSAIDRAAVIDYSGTSRMNHGLVVLFVGAVVALIGYGRSLSPRPAAPARRAG